MMHCCGSSTVSERDRPAISAPPPRGHRRAAARHRARQRARPARGRPRPVHAGASTTTSTRRRRRRGRLQGGPRRVRRRQDLLHPLARRAGEAPRLRRRRGPDLRDRDAAAPAGDRLPADQRALRTAQFPPSALRPVVDAWLFTLEDDALAADGSRRGRRAGAGLRPSTTLLEQRLAECRPARPRLRRRAARLPAAPGSPATRPPPTGLLAWLGGQPHVAAAAKRDAGHQAATSTTSARSASCRGC